MSRRFPLLLTALALLLPLGSCRPPLRALRVGYTLELANAPAIVGFAQRRYGRMGGKAIRPAAFLASPIAVESLAAGDLDVAFVGPVPALNVIMRSDYRFAVVGGVAYGGGALVASKESKAASLEDLRNAKVATTYVGDTTDAAARATFAELGFITVGQGGGFSLVPIPNYDLVRAFTAGDVAAAWTVEPWATELVKVHGARVLKGDADMWTPVRASTQPFQSVVIVARRAIIKHYPRLLEEFLRTHGQIVSWVNENPAKAQELVMPALEKAAGRELEPAVVQEAWKRLRFSTDLSLSSLQAAADAAHRIGFLGADEPDFAKAVDLGPLDRIKKGNKS